MGSKLNSSGSGHASSLIASGKIKDSQSWSAPSTSEENSYIEKHGSAEFGKWHLGVDSDEKEDNKGRWSFPFTSDFEEVDLSGLRACITRAAQSGYSDIETKARSLYAKAKKKLGKGDDKEDAFLPKPKASASARRWLTVRNARNEAGEEMVEMVIAGTIGSSWYDSSGATSKEFREKFNAIPKGKTVRVRINSEGGSIQDALEIYNLIRARGNVATYNDGYALSSASIIHAAGSPAIAPHSSITMIHEPWSMTMGNEEEHRKAAEMLDKHGDTIAAIYARKTGKTADEMRQLMKNETWLTGAEACQMRLADMMAEDSECPDCGHEQCAECETDAEGNITCSECFETNSAHEWEESEATEETEELSDPEDRARNRFANLNLEPFKKIPQHIYNMLRPGATPPSAKATSDGGQTATTPSNDMNKTAVVALLKGRNIQIADNASDDDVLAALNKLGGQTTSTSNSNQDTLILDLRTQVENEKRIRVTAEVRRRGDRKIANDKLDQWIGMAMRDEKGTYDLIDSMAEQLPGGHPASLEYGSVTENFLDEVKKVKGADKAGERFKMLRNSWDGVVADALIRDGRTGAATQYQVLGPDGKASGMRLTPVNANTYTSALITQFLLDGWVTKLQNRWAPLKAFTREFSTDRYKPKASAQLKFVTVGSTNLKNPTSFGPSNSGNTVSAVQIDVDQYHQPFAVTNSELNSGLRLENLVDINVAYMADAIIQVATAPLNTTDFAVLSPIIRASTAFSWSDMATARGELKKSPIHHALLDGEYFARLINQPGFFQKTITESGETQSMFGWDGVWEVTNWTGTHAAANDQYIRGLFCNPQALGVVSGLPLNPPNVPGNTLMESTITIPGVDITVAAYTWFDLATRSLCVSYDLMFGSAKLDTSAALLLTSQ